MSSLNCPSEDDPQASSPGNDPARPATITPVHVVGTFEIPDAAVDEYRANEHKKDRRDRWAFRINVLTLLSVVAATVFTGFSLLVARDALKHATQSSKETSEDTQKTLAIGAGQLQAAQGLADAARKSAQAATLANEMTSETTKRQLAVAERNVAVAERSFLASSEATRLDQRAWIGVLSTVLVPGPPEVGELFK